MADLNDILQRLEPSLGKCTGAPVPLDGGITNRNFRATLGGREYVIRQPGKDTALLGIDRGAERVAADAAAALGIAPAVAVELEDCLVTEFVACSELEEHELERRVEEVARALHAFHHSAVILPARFWAADLLDEYSRIVIDRGGKLPEPYTEAVAIAAEITAVVAGERRRPCHNDLLSGNIIRAQGDGRLLLVDWEYAGMGHPYFDLGNLSINNGFEEATDERLLTAYHGEPPTPGKRAMLSLMRLLSDAREAAWGVVQASVSELDFDFEGYAGRHFERLLRAAARPAYGEWLAIVGGGDSGGQSA
jgi:thiamine kinase-like enzyme